MADNQNENIGERLRAFRKEKGLTQKELALKLDIPQPNISEMESGVRPLGGTLMRKLANEFPDVDIGWIMTGNGGMLLGAPSKPLSIQEQTVLALKEMKVLSEVLWEHYIEHVGPLMGKSPEALRQELDDMKIQKLLKDLASVK